MIEGLAIAGLVGKLAACSYDVPPLEALPDGGTEARDQDSGEPDSGTGGDGGAPGMDAGHDAGTDHDAGTGGMDAGEGGMDAGMGGMDGGVDAGMDAGMGGMDAGMDGGPVDSGTDGGMSDGGPIDSGSPDAGILCGSVTTGSFSGFISLVSPAHVANYTFTYGGIDGSGHALITISCAEGTVDTSESCPVGSDTVVSRPSDGAPAGRTITIHPSAANASNSTLTISVTHP
jgi:hypothetical protein